MVERVTLWDVGAERQCELRGPDALGSPTTSARATLADLAVGGCRYTMPCDRTGAVLADAIALRAVRRRRCGCRTPDVDLDLWADALALARGADVEVQQADVAPLQVQGPRARDMLEPLNDGDLVRAPPLPLRRTRSRRRRRRGLEHRLEQGGGLRALSARHGRALELWDAIVAAGEPHGLLVTGPMIGRAVEQGITDMQYRLNSGMNPIEAGLRRPARPRRRRLRGPRRAPAGARGGPRRAHRGTGAGRSRRCRVMEEFWPVDVDGRPTSASRAGRCGRTRSSATSPIALVDAGVPRRRDASCVQAPDGPQPARPPHPLRVSAR